MPEFSKREVRRKLNRVFSELHGIGINYQIFNGLSKAETQNFQVQANTLGYFTEFLGPSRKYDPHAREELYALKVTKKGVTQNA